MIDNNTGIELCEGCKYSILGAWLESDRETCGVCIQGNERVQEPLKENK